MPRGWTTDHQRLSGGTPPVPPLSQLYQTGMCICLFQMTSTNTANPYPNMHCRYTQAKVQGTQSKHTCLSSLLRPLWKASLLLHSLPWTDCCYTTHYRLATRALANSTQSSVGWMNQWGPCLRSRFHTRAKWGHKMPIKAMELMTWLVIKHQGERHRLLQTLFPWYSCQVHWMPGQPHESSLSPADLTGAMFPLCEGLIWDLMKPWHLMNKPADFYWYNWEWLCHTSQGISNAPAGSVFQCTVFLLLSSMNKYISTCTYIQSVTLHSKLWNDVFLIWYPRSLLKMVAWNPVKFEEIPPKNFSFSTM